MVQLLDKQYQQTKQNLMSELSKASHVSTTADCWTAHRRSFLGMTVHWLDQDEVTRQSACLGVRRIYGSHTYDVLAKAISEMHAEFKISKKVNLTITDNGSNFLKAFKMFQEPIEQREAADEELSEEDEEDVVLTSGRSLSAIWQKSCKKHLTMKEEIQQLSTELKKVGISRSMNQKLHQI